jgi:hypothetical protein
VTKSKHWANGCLRVTKNPALNEWLQGHSVTTNYDVELCISYFCTTNSVVLPQQVRSDFPLPQSSCPLICQ